SMMNDASTPIGQPVAVNPPGKLAYTTPTTAPLVAGRRSFFKYRDLGVTAASSGKIRAQITIGAEGMTQPTGWHYHVCEDQFVYMLSGRVAFGPARHHGAGCASQSRTRAFELQGDVASLRVTSRARTSKHGTAAEALCPSSFMVAGA